MTKMGEYTYYLKCSAADKHGSTDLRKWEKRDRDWFMEEERRREGKGKRGKMRGLRRLSSVM